jgi:S-adenosyl-L-methionine hydrolase (adenosine-forming)
MAHSQAPPIVTLTTDFGLSDHYVGTIKGVILSRCPQAVIIDITHELPAFSTVAGAYAIAQAARFFPAQTFHVVVVDPGVGTVRKPILVQAGNQTFIAPDNGVLALVLQQHKAATVREITNRALWLESPSPTFHGRDIFAPVAASLAAGEAKPEQVGPVLTRYEQVADLQAKEAEPGVWQGIVLSIDRFGNVITNFPSNSSSTAFTLNVKDREVNTFHRTFGEAPAGQLFAFHGSSGYIEIGLNQQSAARALKLSLGDPITLRDTIL